MRTGLQDIRTAAEALKARMAAQGLSATPPEAPAPKCATCQDRGVVGLPPDDPDYGRLMPCPHCAPKSTRSIYGLTLAEQAYTWSTLKPLPVTIASRGSVAHTTADRVGGRIAAHLAGNPGAFIFLYGPFGLGKSRLIKTAVAEALRSGIRAHYANMADILEDIKDAYDATDPRDSARARCQRWRELPFLAMDELDKVYATDWAKAEMFRLFNARYDAAMDGIAATIMASNQPPEVTSEALASRAHDGRALFIELSGRDIRPSMEREK